MAVKDLKKVPHSIFVMAVAVIVLAGVGVLILITRTDGIDLPFMDSDSNKVTGQITYLLEDCVRADSIDPDAEPAVSCDGGSRLIIDNDIEIQTSSGYVPEDRYYWEDISELSAGDSVEITYQKNEYGNYDVNCSGCGVRPL